MENSIELRLPESRGNQDVQGSTQSAWVVGDKDDINTVINLANRYLWIALGVIAMAVMVIGGIRLITARGDEAEMKKVNKMFISAVIGILIAIFSYLLVRLVANLF